MSVTIRTFFLSCLLLSFGTVVLAKNVELSGEDTKIPEVVAKKFLRRVFSGEWTKQDAACVIFASAALSAGSYAVYEWLYKQEGYKTIADYLRSHKAEKESSADAEIIKKHEEQRVQSS